MMNRLIYKLVIAIFCFSLYSCVSDTEIDEVFEGNTQDRVLERLDELNELLLSSEFGWETDYIPGEETGVYKMHMLFNEDGSVEITSDHNNGDNDIDANYRVGISQKPELVFENYSVFSNLTDNFDGTVASTNFDRDAEFQFTFTEEANEDIIVLESKSDLEIQDDEGEFISRKTVLTLVKATTSTKDEIMALQGLDERINDDYVPNPSITNPPYRGFKIENSNSETVFASNFVYNAFDRSSRLVYEKDGEDVEEFFGIGFSEEGVSLAEPFEYEGKSFQNFVYDETTNEFVAEVDGFRAFITRGNLPFYINKDYEEINELVANGYFRLWYRADLTGNHPGTSDAFLDIYDEINATIAPFGDSLTDISIYFDNLSSRSTLVINTAQYGPYQYSYEYSVVDRKLVFDFIGPVDDFSTDYQYEVQGLIDYISSTSGLVYINQGNFQNFINQTAQLISFDNPEVSAYFIWVNF